jgi:hypothetical protein
MNHSDVKLLVQELIELVLDAVVSYDSDASVAASDKSFDPDLYLQERARQEQENYTASEKSCESYDPEKLYFSDEDQDLDGFEENDA